MAVIFFKIYTAFLSAHLQPHEVDVLVEVVGVAVNVDLAQLQLLLLGLEAGRQQPVNSQSLSLSQREGHALQHKQRG